jgi:hypothetical protein
VNAARDAVKIGGVLVIATFALDGPMKCSNLDVMRHSPESLSDEFGDDFELIETAREKHRTPWDSEQQFVYCVFRRVKS